jgi:hypothetical protein
MADLPIRIEFTYTADDYAEGARGAGLHYWSKNAQTKWAAYVTFVFVSLIGGPWIVLSNPGDRFALLLGSALFGMSIWSLYGIIGYFWRIYFGLRREFPRIEGYQGNREMLFDDQGHKTRGPRYFSELSWETYRGFAETKNLFLLFQPPGLFVMVPKRPFTPDQLADFRNLVSNKISVSEVPHVRQRVFFNRTFLIVLGVAVAVTLLLILLLALHLASK